MGHEFKCLLPSWKPGLLYHLILERGMGGGKEGGKEGGREGDK